MRHLAPFMMPLEIACNAPSSLDLYLINIIIHLALAM